MIINFLLAPLVQVSLSVIEHLYNVKQTTLNNQISLINPYFYIGITCVFFLANIVTSHKKQSEKINIALRNTILMCISLVVMLAVVASDHLYFPYIVGKNFGFRTLVELMLVLYTPLAYLQQEYRPKKSLGIIAYTVFIAILFMADIFGVNSSNSLWSNFERMEGFVTHIHLFIFTLISISIGITNIEWKKLFNTILFANAIVLLYAVSDYINIAHANARGAQLGTRLQTLLGNSEYLSIYCAFGIFTACILFARSDRSRFSVKGTLYNSIYFVSLLGSVGVIQYVSVLGKGYMLLAVLAVIAFWAPLVYAIKPKMLTPYSMSTAYIWSIILNFFVLWQTGTRGTILGLIAGAGLAVLWYLLKPIWKDNKKSILSYIAVTFCLGLLIKLMSSFVLTLLALVSIASVSVIIGSIIFLLVYTVKNKTSLVYKIATSLMFLGVVGVLLFVSNKQSTFIQNNPTLKRIAGISLQDQTVRSRILIWKMSWEGVKERPLLGWGQENFIYVFAKEYNPEMFDQEQWFDRSHDVFFDWLVAAGFLGLLSYLALFGATIWTLVEDKQQRFSTVEQSIIIGLITTYFIHNVFVFDSTVSYISFFTLFAYIHTDFTEMKISKKSSTSTGNIFLSIFAISIVTFCFVFYYVVYKPYRLNQNMSKMLFSVQTSTIEDIKQMAQDLTKSSLYGKSEANEQLINLAGAVIRSQASDSDKKFFFDMVISRFQDEIVTDTANPRQPVLLAFFAQGVGVYPLATQSYIEALKRSPNKTLLWTEFAKELVATNNISDAELAAQKAHTLSNRSVDSAVMYSSILLSEKKDKEALTVWQETIAANKYTPDSYAQAAGFLQSRKGDGVLPVLMEDFGIRFPGNKQKLVQYLQELKNATTTVQESLK